jgi:transcriptional regulator with XRE-family HTH domain
VGVTVREFTSEGHRLLLAAPYSPSEIARLANIARPRVSDWRAGRVKPTTDDRQKLQTAVGIPARAWDAPPLFQAPPQPTATPPSMASDTRPPAPSSPELDDDLSDPEIAGMGLEGLERFSKAILARLTGLTPKDQIRAIEVAGRLVTVHEQLRLKSVDARRTYLGSAEFRRDVATLSAAIPASASEFRAQLARFGVDLPPPPTAAVAGDGLQDAPTTADDVEELLGELAVAADLRTRGEPHLALAHVLALGLDVHADAIAAVVLDDPTLMGRFLAALEPVDEARIRGAIERLAAIRSVRAMAEEPRAKVAALLRTIGESDLAEVIAP